MLRQSTESLWGSQGQEWQQWAWERACAKQYRTGETVNLRRQNGGKSKGAASGSPEESLRQSHEMSTAFLGSRHAGRGDSRPGVDLQEHRSQLFYTSTFPPGKRLSK